MELLGPVLWSVLHKQVLLLQRTCLVYGEFHPDANKKSAKSAQRSNFLFPCLARTPAPQQLQLSHDLHKCPPSSFRLQAEPCPGHSGRHAACAWMAKEVN